MINKPINTYKVFGEKGTQTKFSPTKFGSSQIVAKDEYYKIANKAFSRGFEATQTGDVTISDINNVMQYIANALGYIYQQGIPEWNMFQQYNLGSVVMFENALYICIKYHNPVIIPENTECNCCCSGKCNCKTPVVDTSTSIIPGADREYWRNLTLDYKKFEEEFAKYLARLEAVEQLAQHNSEKITKNEEAIAANGELIKVNAEAIATNAEAIATNNNRITLIEKQIQDILEALKGKVLDVQDLNATNIFKVFSDGQQ